MIPNKKQRNETLSRKAIGQLRRDVAAIIRETEIATLIADGVNIDWDGNDLDALEAEEKELKRALEGVGRGSEWSQIRAEACRRFPAKRSGV